MRSLFPVIFAIALIVIFGIMQLLFMKYLNRQWWHKRWVRRATWFLPLAGAISVVLWGYGEYARVNWLAYPGAILAVLTFVAEVGLTLSLPLSGLIHLVNWIFDRLTHRGMLRKKETVDRHRRLFLKAGAATIPLVTLAASAGGVASAMTGARVYIRPIHIEGLKEGIEGLRVLHITDAHLRHYVSLADVEDVLSQAEPLKPELILVTGDIADDIKLLPGALKLIGELNAPFGAYACLGNHEYFRGVSDVIRIYDHSYVRLLVNDGLRIQRENSSVFIGGIDDPRSMRITDYSLFKKDLDETLADVNGDDFVILMSHRPNVFDYAAERAVALTLSGHTHGGQVGLGGRSLFETVWPERYLWGHYRVGESHLYTSSGMGHWFPFRLGCSAEAPVIEVLKR